MKDDETSEKKSKTDWKNNTVNKASYQDQRLLKKLEKEIASLELKKEDIQNQFANNSLSTEDIKSLSIELKGIEDDLSTKTDDWFTRSIELE